MQDGNISLVKAFFRSKWVRIVLTIDFLALLWIIGIVIYNSTKVSTIIFNVAPIDATISANGNTNFQNGLYKITPGSYEINISREGLETKTFNIDIAPHHTVELITFLKDSENNFEFYELKENQNSFQKLQLIASEENNVTTDHDNSAAEFIQFSKEQQQIFNEKLPLNYHEYNGNILSKDITIKESQSKNCRSVYCLKASMILTDDKKLVNEILKNNGFNLEKLEIEYEIYN